MAASRPKGRSARRASPTPAPSPTPGGRRAQSSVAAALLILIAGLAAYSNSFDGIFVFDDEPSIAHNPHLRSLWPLTRPMSAPPDTTLAGRPVASLTFALNHALAHGGSLAGYHAANLAIHLAAGLLLFGVARRTLQTPRLLDTFSGSATSLAMVIALLWVVHPLQTASVTYIVQRVESLMGLFYLAALYCAIRALPASAPAKGLWTAASVSACALGMGTKEVMATAPLMVMLWDRQFAPDRTLSRRPLYAALAATWIILVALLAGGPRASSVGFGFEDWPWWRYLMTQARVLAHYLRLSIVPAPLVLDYEWPAATKVAQVAMPGLVILVLLAATAFGLVRRFPAGFAGAWFFVILAPTSSVVPIVTEVAAEHRMYLPLAGVIALAVLGVFAAGRRLSVSRSARRMLPGAGFAGAGVIALLFAWMTYQRNADYHDYDRIWSDTIAKRPRNARARNNYATSLLTKGRFAEALPHLRVAVEVNPSFVEAEANLGVALSALGTLDEGIAHLQRALLLRPDYAEAYRNLGEAFALQRRLGDAAQQYSKALQYLPDDVELLNRTAWILATTRDDRVRDGGRAKALAERAVRLTERHDAVSLDSLGVALAEVGEFEAAAATAREALAAVRLKSDQAMAAELEHRLRLYERGLRFRDGVG